MAEDLNSDTKNKKPLILVVSLFLLAAGLLFWQKQFLKNSKTRQPATSNPSASKSSLSSLNPIQVANLLLAKRSTLVFPDIISASVSKQSSLPESLKTLLPEQAAQVNIEKLNYVDGTTGYRISFNSATSLQTAYEGFLGFLRSNKWTIKAGFRANQAALIEALDSNFQIRILVEFVKENNTHSILQILTLK